MTTRLGLALALSLIAGPTVAAPPRELFLAGGSLALCSDLAAASCHAPPAGESRTLPRYRLDAAGLRRALSPALWRAPAPEATVRRAWLRAAVAAAPDALLDADAVEARLAAPCVARGCAGASPWDRLDDYQRLSVLTAFEAPQQDAHGQRRRERAFPGDSRKPHGVAVLQAFLAAATARAPGATPRIAVVTASGFDPMDAVDAYLATFRALGAEAVWWPVDAALAEAKFARQDCSSLDALREARLGLSQRARIYPDLDAYQRGYCASDPALLLQVQGVFFAGGDQWRLRQAFVRDDRPNPWLLALREAHARGAVVVGGTSAGSAVQAGGWMLSNGSPAAALRHPARIAPPPNPGCARQHCAGGVGEDALTLWPAGGLGLAEGLIVDTHFSERSRELRLLMALQASQGGWAVGADETSALQITDHAEMREIRAHGESGGWVMRRDPTAPDSVLAWYVAPGAVLRLTPGATGWAEGAPAARQNAATVPADALAPGALRAASQRLAADCGHTLQLSAGPGHAELACTAETATRTGPRLTSIGPLRLRYRRP